jgi:hypothetical protein
MEKPQGINVSDPRAGLLALSMQLTAEHSELIESIYDAGLNPDFKGQDQQVRIDALLLRGRSALHPALCRRIFEA